VRPTAENLFSTLMQHRKETISQVTLQMLEQVTQTATDATDEALLLRESVYLAIGLCSYDLQETLNFGAWFTGPLAASLRPPEPVPKLHRVIRRRIAALMAAFVDSLREATIRDAAYQTAVALLSDSDFVVRVTASDAILHLIDDTAFFPANFRPHLEGAVGGLFRLLYDAAEVDTKLRILNVISVLMESMGPKVRPVVANVVQAVPELWEQVFLSLSLSLSLPLYTHTNSCAPLIIDLSLLGCGSRCLHAHSCAPFILDLSLVCVAETHRCARELLVFHE
jgi:hypothetical protein